MEASIHCEHGKEIRAVIQHFAHGITFATCPEFYTFKIFHGDDEITLFINHPSDLRPILDAISTALCVPTPPDVDVISSTEGDSTPDQPETQNYN